MWQKSADSEGTHQILTGFSVQNIVPKFTTSEIGKATGVLKRKKLNWLPPRDKTQEAKTSSLDEGSSETWLDEIHYFDYQSIRPCLAG